MTTRWIWLAALMAGVTYMLAVQAGWQGPLIIAWKGAGVGLLALWCASRARGTDGWLIATVMAAGATGDVLLDAVGLEIGAIAFAVGHGIAIWLYVRNRRTQLSPSQAMLAWLVVPLSLAICWAVLRGAEGWWHAGVYTAIVAAMAAMAWTSRFPRYRTGIGAMLFLASDLLIFARLGGSVPDALASWLIWPLYFGGQALIASGAVTALVAEDRAGGD